jgi:hypothetical protein
MVHQGNQTRRERRDVAVLLAWVAGFGDGVGYLVRGGGPRRPHCEGDIDEAEQSAGAGRAVMSNVVS